MNCYEEHARDKLGTTITHLKELMLEKFRKLDTDTNSLSHIVL